MPAPCVNSSTDVWYPSHSMSWHPTIKQEVCMHCEKTESRIRKEDADFDTYGEVRP